MVAEGGSKWNHRMGLGMGRGPADGKVSNRGSALPPNATPRNKVMMYVVGNFVNNYPQMR